MPDPAETEFKPYTVDAEIIPLAGPNVEVITTEVKKQHFSYGGGINSMLWRDKYKRYGLGALAGVLLLTSLAECTKPITALTQTDLSVITNSPVVYPLTQAIESPYGIIAITAIGAVALFGHVFKGRERFAKIEQKYRVTPMGRTPPES